MKFLRIVFGSFFGICLFLLLAVLFFAAAASSSDKKVSIEENSVLVLKLDMPIVDKTDNNPLANFDFMNFSPEAKIGLNSTLKSIKKAAKDENIKGIYLNLSTIQAGLGTVEEIRNALIEFKESGKFIVSYSEFYSHKAYYLSSVADELYLFPEGLIEFTGFSNKIAFLKGFLEKTDIDMQIIRHGKFKSAIEPLILNEMSEANKLQTMEYMSDLWDQMLEGVSSTREISKEELQNIADNLLLRNAQDAVAKKLADKTIYKDELLEILKEKLEVEEDEKIKSVCLSKYNNVNDESLSDSDDKIAVIFATGGIESGKGDAETIGSETTSKMIREAREDEDVKAIVLRVNSGGGSALASDVIWREMKLAKAAKPVIVSMGDVAASGGYYIACESNAIFANKNTITGSIGVFGVIPNLETFFKNKAGISFDGVKTGENADMSMLQPLTEFQRSVIQDGVKEIYDDFITKVGEGRNMSAASVDSIGEGRVWSGIDAKRIGLIDEFGGLTDAIDKAAELAELDEYTTIDFPKAKDPIEVLLKELTGESAQTRILKEQLGVHYSSVMKLKELSNMKGVQARLPYEIIIE